MARKFDTGIDGEQNGESVNGAAVNAGTKRRSLIGDSLTALFAALTAAGAFIAIPLPFTPVPIVLQNLFALLSGLVLGPVLGGAAVALYLLAGAIGLPVFAGAAGGVVHFLGPTGGFLFGYLLSAILAGLIAGSPRTGRQTPLWRLAAAALAGMLILYAPGLLRLKAVLQADWTKTLAAGLTPFLIGDAIKTVIAVIAARGLRKGAAKALHG
ncbi:MAG: biotin transporter BioY [Spirochaetaceae bacterium]|jgi:biotin transport system substrate-specific component|nr:biotin transporter BioY [Spirochaetaceae bacterium]